MTPRILLPLDGSKVAERSLGHAVATARALGAEVDVLRVLHAPEDRIRDEPVDPMAWRFAGARAEAYLRRITRQLESFGVRAASRVEEGVPSEVILGILHREGHQFVVLTEHGEGKGSPAVIGGTAVAVILSAGNSILLVPASGGPALEAGETYQEILAPVDCSPRGDWALGIAATIARDSGARLHLVHVLTPPEVLSRGGIGEGLEGPVQAIIQANSREAKRYLVEMKECLSGEKLEVNHEVAMIRGSVPQTLEKLASERGSGLIVLSAHGRGAQSDWPFGSVSGKLLFLSRVPVLVLQDMAGSPGQDHPGGGSGVEMDARGGDNEERFDSGSRPR